MQSHLGSVVLCLISTCVVGLKVLRNFYANCGESVQPLQSVKLIYQLCSRSRAAWTLTWLINLKMDLILLLGFLLCPCWVPTISLLILAYAVQRRTPKWSTSTTARSSEECDQPVRCLWKMKMESRLHSYRCLCKDLRAYPRECNKS
jgi:hypothetical protein